jgi:sulfotransferase
MSHLYAWMGLSAYEIDPAKLEIGIQESDSHYHMKYTHTQSKRIAAPDRHDIPPRIQAHIEAACAWYYQLYYPQKR